MLRDDLLQRLARLDEDASLLFDDDRRFRLIIVGGGALILLETITRATNVIDALDASAEIRSLLGRYDINLNVQAYMNNFPYNYEDRIVPVRLNGSKIDFYTASLEDIVIAKLFSYRATDRQDIINLSVLAALDWDTLENLAYSDDEVKQNALNERNYRDFLADYEEYVRRYRP